MSGRLKRMMQVLLIIMTAAMMTSGTVKAENASISKKTVSMEVGSKATLTIKNVGKSTVKWSTSNKKIIALKKGKKKVTITGKKSGKCYVIAQVGKKKYKCKVTVASKRPFISKTKTSVKIGTTVTIRMKNAGNLPVKWSISNKRIATIKANKTKVTIKGKKTGTCIVAAKVGKRTYKCKVTVKAAVKSEEPYISNSRLTLWLGESSTISIKNAGDHYVSWSISDEDVALIWVKGSKRTKAEPVGIRTGSCQVVAKVGKKRIVCNVTVKNKYTYDVSVLNPQYNIYAGDKSLDVITQPGLLTGDMIIYIKTEDPSLNSVSVAGKGDRESAGYWKTRQYDDVTPEKGGCNNLMKVKGGYLATFRPGKPGNYYINLFCDVILTDWEYYGKALVWTSEKPVEIKDFLTAETEWLKSVMSGETNGTMSTKRKLDALEVYVEKNFKYQMNIDGERLVYPTTAFGAYFETGRIDCVVATRIMCRFADLLGLKSESTYAGFLNHHYATIWIDGKSYVYDPNVPASSGTVPPISKII